MEIQEIANKINKAGGRLYLVGGALRDSILNRPIYDEDYCVTGISVEKFEQLFPTSVIRGKSFKVFDLEHKEFALARREIKIGDGHKNFEIITEEKITIQEDLKRRDITINSIAKDVLTNEIIDPFNGIQDIKNKVIKATSNSFNEDPLRVYRVARLASKLEFEVDKNTLKLMNGLKNELLALSKERVFTEFKKALSYDKPSIFFKVLQEAKVLDIHFKEIYNLIGAIQPEQYHPEGDSYNHTMMAIDNCTKLTKDLQIRYATLVHDLGKGKTPKEMYPHHHGHEKRGVDQVKNFSKRLGVPTAWEKCGVTSTLEHMRGGIFYKMTPSKKVQFIERVNKSLLGIDGLQIVVYADKYRGEGSLRDENYNFSIIGKKLLNEIDGKYIEQKYKDKRGIEFGKILHKERVKWMNNTKLDDKIQK